MHEEIGEWQNRPLTEVYALLFLDAILVKIRQDGAVTNKPVLLAIGVDCSGRKQLLGLWIQQQEGAKVWLKVLKALQQRGVKDVLIAVTDALSEFPAAIGPSSPRLSCRPVWCICCATPCCRSATRNASSSACP